VSSVESSKHADRPFDLPGDGHVLFTTRAHGNMSSVGGLDHEHGLQARERLRAQLGVRHLLRGYQAHGTTILRARTDADIAAWVSTSGQPPVEADGHTTTLVGIGAMVLAADCLPVALGSERAVAMVHAGWRGLAAGVLEEGVRALRDMSGEDEIEIGAIIGPGAGACCYEVGPVVHAAFAHASTDTDSEADTDGEADQTGGLTIDLKAIARDRLLAAGVTRVLDVGTCTICDERFFSHRREGASAGRNAGVAWLG
jgi:YfiH family protein